jgi:hypothetical protein
MIAVILRSCVHTHTLSLSLTHTHTATCILIFLRSIVAYIQSYAVSHLTGHDLYISLCEKIKCILSAVSQKETSIFTYLIRKQYPCKISSMSFMSIKLSVTNCKFLIEKLRFLKEFLSLCIKQFSLKYKVVQI